MKYHASLITADGAYHCPVGSIMAIFILHDGNVNGDIGDPEDILELILLFRIICLFLMALILVIF